MLSPPAEKAAANDFDWAGLSSILAETFPNSAKYISHVIPDFRIGSHAPATRFKLISRADLRALSKQHKPSDLPFATPPQPGSLRRLLYNSATSILRSSPSTINFWSIISACDQSNSSRASKSLALDTYLIHPSQPLDRRPSDRLYRMK